MEKQDPNSIFLIVEGWRDHLFFKMLVPHDMRKNSTVISIDEIEVPENLEGNRGRILWLHGFFLKRASFNRIFFFIDSDSDRMLDKRHSDQVISTDFSDFESYVYNDCSMSHLLYVFGEEPDSYEMLKIAIQRLVFPIKKMRVLSKLRAIELPVNRTVIGRLSRFTDKPGMNCQIDDQRLLSVVLQNSELTSDEKKHVIDQIECMTDMGLSLEHWAQGKDIVSAISRIFSVNFDEASRHVSGAINACLESLRKYPALNRVEKILRS